MTFEKFMLEVEKELGYPTRSTQIRALAKVMYKHLCELQKDLADHQSDSRGHEFLIGG